MPADQAGNAINLAGIIVREFLADKVQAPAMTPLTSAARAVMDNLFTEINLSEQQSRWLVALNPVIATDPVGSNAFLPNRSGQGVVLNDRVAGTTSRLPDLRDPLSGVRSQAAVLLRSFDPVVVTDRILAAELGLPAAEVTALRGFPVGVPVIDTSEIVGDKATRSR